MKTYGNQYIRPKLSKRRLKICAAAEQLEAWSRPAPEFTPSAEFVAMLNRQWDYGYPDNNAFVMHMRADPDEVVGRILVIVYQWIHEFLKKKPLFKGASLETPVLYTQAPEDFSDRRSGKLFLGVGVGANEHKLPPEYQENECCATLTRKILGLEKDDPLFAPVITSAVLDDLHASSARDSLAQFMKRAYRLGTDTPTVVGWATDRYLQWHEELKSGSNFTVEDADPQLVSKCVTLLQSAACLDLNNPRLYVLEKAANLEKRLAADSLMKMAIRANCLSEPPEQTLSWFASKVNEWYHDLVNSSPENLWPELQRAGELEEMTIQNRKITLAIIHTDRLADPKYTEYLAKFARWEKGWDASLVFQRNADGNTQIFPNKRKRPKVRLRGVAHALMKIEPDWWHFPHYEVILNGSLKHNKPPTRLQIQDLKDLVKDNAWLE